MEPPQQVINFVSQSDSLSRIWFFVFLSFFVVCTTLVLAALAGQKAVFEMSAAEKKKFYKLSPRFTFLKDANGFLFSLAASLIFFRLMIIVILVKLCQFLIVSASQWVSFVCIAACTVVVFWLIEFFAQIIAHRFRRRLFLIAKTFFWVVFSFPLFAWVRKLVAARLDYLVRMNHKSKITVATGELEKALELTIEENLSAEEHKILEGIVKFGNTEARQIMRSRVDLVSVSKNCLFDEVMNLIRENGYSRMPVFENRQDNVVGVLYIKDLLPFLNESNEYEWQQLIREPFYIPETKKIDDLLKEFQYLKSHMAIVVDEYGGTSGIVTLEDVLEEILGDISDEFDDDDVIYSKIDDTTYVFEGRTALNDFYKITKVNDKEFEERKGIAETLGGFIVEANGRILKNNEFMELGNVRLIVESSDKRRVKLIKVEIN